MFDSSGPVYVVYRCPICMHTTEMERQKTQPVCSGCKVPMVPIEVSVGNQKLPGERLLT